MGGRRERLQRRNLEILPWHAGMVLGKSKLKLGLECQRQEKVSTALLIL